MKLALTPMRHPERLKLTVCGDVLTLNGEAFDFSDLPDGATLPRSAVACDWLSGDVQRVQGQIDVPLILPHGASAPRETRFPAVLHVDRDGPVTLPLYEVKKIEEAGI